MGIVEQMLGNRLITKQTPPEGVRVGKVQTILLYMSVDRFVCVRFCVRTGLQVYGLTCGQVCMCTVVRVDRFASVRFDVWTGLYVYGLACGQVCMCTV